MKGITYVRQCLNLTMQDLANSLGVGKTIVSNWESGLKQIPDKRLDQLETLYKLPKEFWKKDLEYLDKLMIDKALMESQIAESVCWQQGTNDEGDVVEIYKADEKLVSDVQSIQHEIENELHKTKLKKIEDNITKENIDYVDKFIETCSSTVGRELMEVLLIAARIELNIIPNNLKNGIGTTEIDDIRVTSKQKQIIETVIETISKYEK